MSHHREDVRFRPRRGKLFLLVIATICVALVIFAYAAATSAEILAKGQLFSYSQGTIYKVSFFHHWILYVEPDVKPSLDVVNTYVLVVVSTVSLSTLALLRWLGISPSRQTTAFLLLLGLGTLYLGVDELLGIHETIGHNMRFLAKIPGNKQPDGAVVASYLIPIGAFLWIFRRRLMASRITMRLAVFALAMAVLAVAADVIDGPGEELFEPLTSLSLSAAFIVVIARELRSSLTDHGLIIYGGQPERMAAAGPPTSGSFVLRENRRR